MVSEKRTKLTAVDSDNDFKSDSDSDSDSDIGSDTDNDSDNKVDEELTDSKYKNDNENIAFRLITASTNLDVFVKENKKVLTNEQIDDSNPKVIFEILKQLFEDSGASLINIQHEIYDSLLNVRKRNGVKLTKKKLSLVAKLYKQRNAMIENYNNSIETWNKNYNCFLYPKLNAKDLYDNDFIVKYECLTQSNILTKTNLIMINLVNIIDRCTEELEYCFNDVETIISKSNKYIKEANIWLKGIYGNGFLERGKRAFINEYLNRINAIKSDAESKKENLDKIRNPL